MKELLLSLFGFAFVYVGIKVIRKVLNLKKNGIKTLGTVVSTRPVSATNNDADDVGPVRWMYRSTVKFTTKNNQILEVELGEANSAEDTIGSKRKIIYNPQSPEEVEANNVFSMVIGPWLALVFGLIMFIWGILEMFSIINIIK